MNTTFKKGNFYIAPKLNSQVVMMVSLIKSNGEDCMYGMVDIESYVTIPYWQLDYFREFTTEEYEAHAFAVYIMRDKLNNTDKTTESVSSAIEPSHYGGADNTYEAIKVIEAWDMNFCLGNVVKYISRAGKKDKDKELEDLLKAQWYLNKHIESWQKENQ